ncbi:MAG TPA: DinB family protein [Ktedonobacterales bacterium]|jgi:hypothetical protein|nr:DinB family protein [Ktedonobacterales bacterium]
MSEAQHLAEALEVLFTGETPGWFSPIATATDGLTAEQASTVPRERFNSVWAVVNHVRFWQEAALRQLQGQEVDYPALGSEDGSGWPPAGEPGDEAAWHAARARALEANAALATYVAGLTEADLDTSLGEGEAWNTRRHLVYSMLAHNSYHTCEIISIRHMQGLWFGAM